MQETNFERLKVYQLAEQLADKAWHYVSGWEPFARNTVGSQLVRAADSVGANLAEGLGRGSVQDNRRFARIARGSLYEVKHWLNRVRVRTLVNEDDLVLLQNLTQELLPRVNAYIGSLNRKC